MKPELPQHWMLILETIFKKWSPDFEVWVYGSRVTGQCHEASDLDLVLIHPAQPDTVNCQHWLDIKHNLSESDIPIQVDVQDWARLSKEFQSEINRNKVKLFDACPATKMD